MQRRSNSGCRRIRTRASAQYKAAESSECREITTIGGWGALRGPPKPHRQIEARHGRPGAAPEIPPPGRRQATPPSIRVVVSGLCQTRSRAGHCIVAARSSSSAERDLGLGSSTSSILARTMSLRLSSLLIFTRQSSVEPPRAPDLTPQRERPLELGLDLRPSLRAPTRVQHQTQDAVDAEPWVPAASVGQYRSEGS